MPMPGDYDIMPRGLRIAGAVIIALIVALAFWAGRASAAAAPLPIVHSGCVAGDPVSKCTGALYRATPAPTDLVRICATVENCWANGTPVVAPLGTLAGPTLIDACELGAADGDPVPYPWTAAADKCTSWKPIPVASLFQGTFSASVIQGPAPLSTVLTWDVSAAGSCMASGSWIGAKPVKGSQAIANLQASASYTLTCSTAPADKAVANLSWEQSVANADDAPLPIDAIAGNRIAYGSNEGNLNMLLEVPRASATPIASKPGWYGYQLGGLDRGLTWYLAMTTYRTDGAESARSATLALAIAGAAAPVTWTKTVQVTVLQVPTDPVVLGVEDVNAYRFDQAFDKPIFTKVGTVPLGTTCVKEHQVLGLYRVPRALVVLLPNTGRPATAYAKCR